MTSQVSTTHPAASDRRRRQIGKFAVGVFAGLCAAFVPHLALTLGAPANAAANAVDLFPLSYVIPAVVLSLLVGGVVVIFEGDSHRPPRDTFMFALGIPALIASTFNTTDLNKSAVQYGNRVEALSSELAEREAIRVETGDERPQASGVPISTGAVWALHVVPAWVAADGPGIGVSPPPSAQDHVGRAVRYREDPYWVVLYTASTKNDADAKLRELQRYGQLTVAEVDTRYLVRENAPLPYSRAVQRAIEIKRQSEEAIVPTLVRVR